MQQPRAVADFGDLSITPAYRCECRRVRRLCEHDDVLLLLLLLLLLSLTVVVAWEKIYFDLFLCCYLPGCGRRV